VTDTADAAALDAIREPERDRAFVRDLRAPASPAIPLSLGLDPQTGDFATPAPAGCALNQTGTLLMTAAL